MAVRTRVPAREFNAAMRAAERVALMEEEKLAAEYLRALHAAARASARWFSANTITADTTPITAASDWTPPEVGNPNPDPYLDGARRQREQAAARIEQTLTARMNGLGISFDPDVFKVFSPDLLEGLAQHANQAFSDVMRQDTAIAIRDSFDKGLSVPDTAKAIREKVAGVGPAHATMLARTDLIGLANGGSFMAARMVYPDPGQVKTWLSTPDARTRPTHAAAGGQTVPLEAPFRVGGYDLMYPGDGQAPPAEVIQCRCTFTVADGPRQRPAPEPAPLVAQLTQAEQQAIANYTGYGTMGQGYVQMNRVLRGQQVIRGANRATHNEQVALLDSAIAKAPPLANEQTVYRAFADPPPVSVGTVLEDAGFMSTSATRTLPESWAGTHGDIWEIKLPAGTRALDLNANVRADLLNPREQEILLGRGSRLVVESVEERVTVYANGNRVVAHNVRARLEPVEAPAPAPTAVAPPPPPPPAQVGPPQVPSFTTTAEAVEWAQQAGLAREIEFGTLKAADVTEVLRGLLAAKPYIRAPLNALTLTRIGGRALAKYRQRGGETEIQFSRGVTDQKGITAKAAKTRETFAANKEITLENTLRQMNDETRPQQLRDIAAAKHERAQDTPRWTVWETTDQPTAALIAHEAGHWVYHVNHLANAWSKALHAHGAERTYRVSEYGASSLSELWAEVFSARAAGQAGTIPAEIMEAMEEVLASAAV